MPEVFVAAGSNVEPRHHLAAGLEALAARFGVLRLSPVYRNPPVGFEGEDFLNMVIAFESDEEVGAIAATLATIEAANGRGRTDSGFSPRTLDLDLLLYGDLVLNEGAVRLPRAGITRYPFVLKPLADLAGERTHPVLGRSFAELWQSFDGASHPLQQVEADFLMRPES
jgi:2-amino-4-hydroxy-6-hydroxymethyldihydropteridine diphosphokinase